MEMDDDNDGEPPAPGTEEDASVRPPLPPGTAGMKVWGDYCATFNIVPVIDSYLQNTKSAAAVNLISSHSHSLWSHQAHWGRVRNVKPVSRIKPLRLAAVPFSTPSLLSVQVKYLYSAAAVTEYMSYL